MSKNEIEISGDISRLVNKTNERIIEIADKFLKNSLIYEPTMHFLKAPGKLIRPALVLTSAIILGKEPKKYIDLAASIEFLHTASLIHDDIIDKDEKRRGIETVQKKYGIDGAILAGDMLFALAVNTASAYGREVLEITSKAAADMCIGEFLDSGAQKNRQVLSLDEYLNIAKLKTASLISSATSVVAVYEKDEYKNKILKDFGINIGMSFQIRDDILNYLKRDKLKDSTSDINNFRPNIVAVYNNLNSSISPVKAAIEKNNEYIQKAKESLKKLEDSSYLLPYVNFLKVEED
ncbi:MAG: polyprenyl synthetase family protein [Candidatus Micrarchaeia archaeon]